MVECVAFSAKYKDWISIKKMLVHPDTGQGEVAFMLAGIAATTAKKGYQFAGIDIVSLNARAEKTFKSSGGKKGFANAITALAKIDSSGLDGISKSYLIDVVLEQFGCSARITQEAMAEIYPHLKITKPRGRFSKK